MTKTAANLKEKWHKLDRLYDAYSKKNGLNFASILILELLRDTAQPVTQKEICNKLVLPKQFVNSIITQFWEKGYVELKEARDRRNKNVLLTDTGREYVHTILKPLDDAEDAVLNSFTVEEVRFFMEIVDKYVKVFEAELKTS